MLNCDKQAIVIVTEENIYNVGESSCNFGDGTDQRAQSLMFVMMMKISPIIRHPFFWNKILRSLAEI